MYRVCAVFCSTCSVVDQEMKNVGSSSINKSLGFEFYKGFFQSRFMNESKIKNRLNLKLDFSFSSDTRKDLQLEKCFVVISRLNAFFVCQRIQNRLLNSRCPYGSSSSEV